MLGANLHYLSNSLRNIYVQKVLNKDNEILESLESYSRNGVPLYIYWKPGMDESKILPAILTEQILLDNF